MLPRASLPEPPRATPSCRDGYLTRAGGLRLYHCEWSSAEPFGALLVLLHGFAEHCRRYDEFARYLAGRGHTVCLLDARGHGRSGGPRGHVRNYAEYVDDLASYVASVRQQHGERRFVLMGHSNGGLVAIRALQSGRVQADALVVTSPLLALPRSRQPVPDWLARGLSFALGRLPLPNGINSQDLTRDPHAVAAHAADRFVHHVATPRWYASMRAASRQALREAQRVSVPLLAVCAERDVLVDTAAVRQFHASAASADKQLVVREGAYHEVLNELDRQALFALIADWIERRARASAGLPPPAPA